VLDALRARGLRLGVISNWDTRLPELLRQLDLARRLDVVAYSSAVGVEKPDSRIFRRALRELGVEPRAALHVGDSRLEDLEGAIAAGMRALLLVRGSRPDAAGANGATGAADAAASKRRAREPSGLRDLSPLPALITAGAARGGASR